VAADGPPGGGAPPTPAPPAAEPLARLSVAEARDEGVRAVEALRSVLDAARRRSNDLALATEESTAIFKTSMSSLHADSPMYSESSPSSGWQGQVNPHRSAWDDCEKKQQMYIPQCREGCVSVLAVTSSVTQFHYKVLQLSLPLARV
jgi:hypothetical protein